MSLLKGTGALILWMDVAPDLEREVDGWYIDEHLPERIDIGEYRRARRYAALEGRPAYLSLFEADTPDALASAGYLRLVSHVSDSSKRIRAGFSNVTRNTFLVRRSLGRGIGAVMGTLRLRLAAEGDHERAEAAVDAVLPDMLARHGMVGVHALTGAPDVRRRMDALRVTGLNDASAGEVLLVEGTRRADVEAVLDEAGGALAPHGWAVEAAGIYGLLYEVSTSTHENERLPGVRR